jgi:hypothetical protein
MIEVIIFYLHVIFLVYIFSKTYIEENFQKAFLSSIFVVVIFTVGWTFSSFIVGMFIPDQGLTRILTKAAFSLTLLTILEMIFYKFYFGESKKVKEA